MPNVAAKKIGPLPAWAWVLGGLAFVGMVWYFRRSTSQDDTAIPAMGDDSLAAPAGVGAGYDGPSGSGSLYGSDVTYADTGSPVGYPPDFFSGLADALSLKNSPIYESPTAPYQTEPTTPNGGIQTVTAPTATKQTSFTWGGRIWRSGDYAAFKRWLTAHGTSYSVWAKNHPKAAMDVFGRMT